MTTPENNREYDMNAEHTQAWLRRMLDEQMRQTQQLNRIARAANLYFWITLIGLILAICGPVTVAVLSIAGLIQGLQIPSF